MASGPELSVVISCYFEEKSIGEFHARLSETLASLGRSYEVVYVNDGSEDGTLRCLDLLFDEDECVGAVVDLFRNSGQAAAVTAGCAVARGETFVFIDSDLQLEPEELPLLLAEYDRGKDVVCGYRRERHDPVLRRISSRLANVAMRRVSRSAMRDIGCNFKIVDGRLVRAFESGPFKPLRAPALIAVAQRRAEVPVTHRPRRYGRSGWSLRKLFSFSVENLVGMSERPFQILSLACFAAGLLLLLRVLLSVFFPGSLLAEVSNGLLLNAVAFSLLIVLAVLSIAGEYVIRTYRMVRRDPAYVVRKIRRREPDA